MANHFVTDDHGESFDIDSASHAYGYDGSNNLTTDTATEHQTGHVRVKTYTYSGTVLQSESLWVRQ